MINIYYRLKTSITFNYNVDPVLDSALKVCIKSGLKSINSVNSYFTNVVFNNGTKLQYWNENKYHAWMNEGVFEFPNGERYHFDDSRPTAKTMYKMKCLLSNFDYNK
jgi:hypothetical protein